MNNKKPIGGIGGGIVAQAANTKMKSGIGRGIGGTGVNIGEMQASAIPQIQRANTNYNVAGMGQGIGMS